MTEKKAPVIPFHINLAMSGLCGSGAWLFTHPFELLKNRSINMAAEGGPAPKFFATAKAIHNSPGGLYKGVDAGLMRQLSYTSFRIGFYDPIRNLIVGDRKATMIDRAAAGATAGACASFLSSPVEVALVCQSKSPTNMTLPTAMSQVYSQSGISGFWRGCVPLMSRAAIVGISQVGFYDQVATWLKNTWPQMDYRVRAIDAGVATGIFYAFVTMPIEVSRVLLSGQQGAIEGRKYRNMPQTIVRVAKERGITSLYSSYIPYAGRCTVHSIVCFLLIELCKEELSRRGY